jgi:trans-aconitate methyltransferase
MTTTPPEPAAPAQPDAYPDRVDTTVPHAARRYDCWLGGKDNFAADRKSAERIAAIYPDIVVAVRENRRFMCRVVDYLAAEVGITQFLDIGTGIPTAPNVHQIAQRTHPSARVVYVDNDPLVMAHARALLVGEPEGVTEYVEVDARDTDALLSARQTRKTLDFTKPIAVLLIAVLHFLPDDEAYQTVSRLVDALPAGSFVAISHGTADYMEPETWQQLAALAGPDKLDGPYRPRTRDEVTKFFDGFTLTDPGVCSVVDWQTHRDPSPESSAKATSTYGAVARLESGDQ